MTWLTNPYRFGSGAPMPGDVVSARYWRFYALARPYDTTDTTISEITLAATIGGANQIAGKTYTASNSGASNAFDGNSGTAWSAGQANFMDQWVQVDAGTPVAAAEVGFQASSNAVQMPSVVLMRYSDDGLTWASYAVVEAGQFTNGQSKTFAVVLQDMTDDEANARAWETYYTAHASSELWVREIQFRTSYGSGAPSAQGDFSYNSRCSIFNGNDGLSSRLFDGNTGTYCVSNNASLTPLRHGFVRATPVGAMQEMRINPEGGTMPTALGARWSPDGFTWHTKKSFTGFSLSNGSWTSFDLR